MRSPSCPICLQAVIGDLDRTPWTAPCAHMCHLYCLERLAEVSQCTISDLRCPFCPAQFSLFCRPPFQLSPAGHEVFDEAEVEEDDSSSTSASSDHTSFDYEDAAPQSSYSDRTLFDYEDAARRLIVMRLSALVV